LQIIYGLFDEKAIFSELPFFVFILEKKIIVEIVEKVEN
jgi:hypothetical protein